jgi:hypothetical protein
MTGRTCTTCIVHPEPCTVYLFPLVSQKSLPNFEFKVMQLKLRIMKKFIALQQMQNANVLEEWSSRGKFFSFITKDTWIEQIYQSYNN